MSAHSNNDDDFAYGYFNKDGETDEMLFYSDGGKKSNLTVNCGVYLVSADLY